MHPNEFDKALRDRYDGGNLPPDLAQWEQLAKRLDIHESALPPSPKTRRGIIALWPVWAAAASMLFIGWLFLQKPGRPMIAGNTTPTHAPAEPSAPTNPSIPTATATVSAGTVQPVRSEPAAPGRLIAAANPARLRSMRDDQHATVIPGQAADSVIAGTSGTGQPVQPEPAQAQSVAQAAPRYETIDFAGRDFRAGAVVGGSDDDIIEERRQLGFDVNGGYGPGSLKRNYAVGVTVNRKVSERLRVEAAVAVVSGAYQSYSTGMAAAFEAGVAELPVNNSARLTYIQAAPGVSYELRSGLFAGAGVDAQRLLSSRGEATGYEYSGDQLEAQPAWDFGYTVRAGYRVNRRIKAGMQYRNSLHTTAPVNGSSVQARNYLLFQLGYVIQ